MPVPVYLDHNATTAVRPEAVEAVTRVLTSVGNPSSVHAFGRKARRVLEDARDAIAELTGAAGAEIVFTSGGTEANNLALIGNPGRRVLVSSVEHPSVIDISMETIRIPVDADGVVRLDALGDLLARESGPVLVSVMLANNETGVIQPVGRITEIAKSFGAMVHCDAVQAVGKVPVDMASLGVDMLSVSAHKIGGPQGVGALILAPGVRIEPRQHGGGQERRNRPGTENLPGIAGFGAAAATINAGRGNMASTEAMRDRLEAELRRTEPDLVIFGEKAPRLPNTSCLAVPGLASEMLVPALDLEGVAISAGSACSSGKVRASHVLVAMAAGEVASGAIRVSFGWNSDDSDVEKFLGAWDKIRARARIEAVAETTA
ncbi:MAG: cysteine desulfurase [Rhodospirillales bacterium]|nr:cysteine desulfurase [Rhodospirillales bacterium]